MEMTQWWRGSEDILLLQGAVRSGKSYGASIAYIMWSMFQFNNCEFIFVGQTYNAIMRNVIYRLISVIKGTFKVTLNKSEGFMTVQCTVNGIVRKNTYWIFGGGKDGDHFKLVGSTMSGAFIDEAVLCTRDVFEECKARCALEPNAKIWGTLNPRQPSHWLHTEYIKKAEEQNVKVMLFFPEDNPAMSQAAIEKLHRSFTGVYYDRNVKNLWVAGDGLLFQIIADDPERYQLKGNIPAFSRINIGVDWGDGKSEQSLTATGILPNYSGVVALRSVKKDVKGLDHTKIMQSVVDFTQGIQRDFGKVSILMCDVPNTNINSARTAIREAGLNIPVDRAYKPPIEERIPVIGRMLGLDMIKYIQGESDNVKTALAEVVHCPKNPEVWDDTGTSDINSLDSFFYGWSDNMSQFSRIRSSELGGRVA